MLYTVQDLNLTDKEKCQKINAKLKCLQLDDVLVDRVRAVFMREMELALNMQSSSLQMENTYIPELPDGTENGDFLAMDLGGTNLRVMILTLEEGKVVNEIVQYYPIPSDLFIGCGAKLFDFLASCVDVFAKDQKLRNDITYPLGFTFSFPMRQNGLDSGVLVTWTKSFNCPSVVGEDAVLMLRDSLKKCGRTNIDVVAILNDTTGTLMHGAFLDPRTRVGIVLGTGSNGCYMESADRVKHWVQERHSEYHVIIDVEWGAFGDNGVLDFMKTDFDKVVDDTSLLKNSFTFEKYIGGKYLGELCRVILSYLHSEGLFLEAVPDEDFPAPWTFGSDNVSIIEHDTICGSYDAIERALDLYFRSQRKHCTDDLEIVRYVCGLITLRAAKLVALVTSVLLNRMDTEPEDVTVAIDGSVYKHHPRLRHWISEFTSIWAPSKKSTFILAEDGSGKGAALVAAIAERIHRRLQEEQLKETTVN